MNETVLPEVTTILLVRGENSIDAIGLGKLRFVVSFRVRRSHHLSPSLSIENAYMIEGLYGILLDLPVLPCRHTCVLPNPDNTLDGAIMRQRTGTVEEQVWLGIGTVDIEHPHLLFLPASEKMRRAGRESDASDYVIVREGLETFAGVRVPDLANQGQERVQ